MKKNIIRQPVCFNCKNKSHMQLYEKCKDYFGENMSGGIRDVLWLYFFGNKENVKKQNIKTEFNDPKDINHDFEDVSSVL